MMGETQEELSLCPTFNSYSLDRLAEIATRVTDECAQHNLSVLRHDNEDDIGDGDDFEFSLVKDGPGIFYDGQLGPNFPIFNRDLVVNGGHGDGASHRYNKQELSDSAFESQIGIPLKDLFLQDTVEREPSSSSSEADEMEGIPSRTYWVWRPKRVVSSPPSLADGKKSYSTGSASKRWKFLNLLKRSNSEGKDPYVFSTPKHGEIKSGKDQPSSSSSEVVIKATRKLKTKAAAGESAHEALYVRNRAVKQGYNKKSYLPYRKDLLGFFASVNGLSRTRTFPPF